MLVAEATQQAPAASRDLRRIEREVLVLGERQADRPELRQPARAAVLAAAAAHPVQPLRLVARADLAQLDARAKRAREIAHQGAKVHTLLGGEVHRELLPVPLPLGIGDLHGEGVPVHLLHHAAPDIVFFAVQLLGLRGVDGGGASEHSSRYAHVAEHLRILAREVLGADGGHRAGAHVGDVGGIDDRQRCAGLRVEEIEQRQLGR